MQITITLKQEARAQARAALELRGIPVAEDWFGPVFENARIVYDHFAEGIMFCVAVEDEQGAEYLYPFSAIARIKVV